MSKFKSTFTFITLLALLVLTGCKSSSGDSLSNSSPSSNSEYVDDYDQSLSWSAPNHLYIHYQRINDEVSEYNNWTIWAWQKEPHDLGGIQIDWSRYDQSGAIADLDFTNASNLNHLFVTNQTMDQVNKVGFLIVLKSSMTSGRPGMWTSDGGSDMYIREFSTHIRSDGSMHLFAQQGNVSQFSYTYKDEQIVDPYANDTGSFISQKNVNSSQSSYPMAKTSSSFAGQVGVGYQIFTKSFADSDNDGVGDLNGVIDKLSYISDLGAKAIWLTPIQKSETYHGYDVTDYYDIDQSVGTLFDYAKLIYQAHQLDIKVLMDLVVNHTSKQNVWFQKSVNLIKEIDHHGEEVDYRSFYHWKYDPTHQLEAPWYRHGETNYYYYAKFASNMPELNFDYQKTRDAMIDVAKYWAAFGVDGFRIDAVKHIYMKDESSNAVIDEIIADNDGATDYSNNKTKNINFFKEFNYRLKSTYPNLFLLGENFDGYDQRIAGYYQGMDSQLDFQNYYHLVNMVNGIEVNNVQEESAVYQTKYNFYRTVRTDFINGAFTSNHDVARPLNHVSGTKSGNNMIDAPTISVNQYDGSLAKAMVYNAATLLQPGLSWIYYGDELGMTSNIETSGFHQDRWYRQPLKWDNSDTSYDTSYTFESYQVTLDATNRNKVNGAAQQKEDANSMYTMMKSIAGLKGQHATLINGHYDALEAGNINIFAYQLFKNNQVYYLYFNFSNATISTYQSLGNDVLLTWKGASKTQLPPYSWIVTN